MKNQEIARIFARIGDILELKDVKWKPKVYRRASRTIESLSRSVADLYKEGGLEALERLPRIGKILARKIEEYLKTGTIKEYERLTKSVPKGLLDILKIPGVGPKKAKILYNKLGIKTLSELEEAAHKKRIQSLKNFREQTELNILEGINLLKNKGGRVALGSALYQAKRIIMRLEKIEGVKKIEIAGSLRRRKDTIGDIDLLVVSRRSKPIMDRFTTMSSVKKVFSKGETKSSILLKSGIQVDLRVLPPSSFGSSLQYFTGSKEHNISLRRIALRKGFKLSEYGLFDKMTGKKIAGASEKLVYNKLGLKFIPPEIRENTGEIEAAKKNKLPKLITLKDIKGNLHTHTTYSDGLDNISAMVDACRLRGYDYMCVTDHVSKITSKSLTIRTLRKQMKEIERMNKNLDDFRVLKGVEVDILKDGSLAFPDEILKELDFVIASIHTRFNQSRKEMTERLLKAINNDNVDMIAHPTGRLIARVPGYAVDLEKVFSAAEDTKTILEINSQPDRLDLNGDLVREAKEFGVKFAVTTDAHSVDFLNFINLGLAMARRGWCKKRDIVNSYPLNRLLRFLD